jgi:hypothetical protein
MPAKTSAITCKAIPRKYPFGYCRSDNKLAILQNELFVFQMAEIQLIIKR